jgi:hypothetical protein
MKLSTSVGRGGVNQQPDVRRVQAALNVQHRLASLDLIAEDGLVGPETIGAIVRFQRSAGLPQADGRIDPRGPTQRALEDAILATVEAELRQDAERVIQQLSRALLARHMSIPRRAQPAYDAVLQSVQALRGGAMAASVQFALYYPPPRGMVVRPVMAAAVAVPLVAAEAAMLVLVAIVALLILIQLAPAMSRAMEDLMRQLQVLMAKLIDEVDEAVKGIEDLIKRNGRAGMACSAAVIAFRELSARLLKKLADPRPADDVGRKRLEKELVDLMTQWQAAMNALLACLTANGAT